MPWREPQNEQYVTALSLCAYFAQGVCMATITKKELIDRIAEQENCKRVLAKRIIQSFLDSIISELSHGNRLEFRDFGVFECRHRASRRAQNPKTLDKLVVPPKRTVKFKVGRIMKQQLLSGTPTIDDATGLVVGPGAVPPRKAAKPSTAGARTSTSG